MDSKKIIDPDGFVSQFDCDDMECTNDNCIKIKNNWNNLLMQIVSIMKRIDYIDNRRCGYVATDGERDHELNHCSCMTANNVIRALLDTIEGHK